MRARTEMIGMNLKLKTFVFLITLSASLLAPDANAQTASQSQNKLSSMDTEPVVLHVTATDKSGGFVMGLKPENFEVSINKKPARIASLNVTDSPVSVGILLDSSGSAGQRWTSQRFLALREAIQHFISAGNPANDYFLIGFNTKAQLLADWTSDPATLSGGIDRLHVYGSTALYDACYLALDKLRSARHAKQALILISDGQDNVSHYTFNELRESLRETNVLLYSLNFDTTGGVLGGSGLETEGEGILNELSYISGAKFFSDKDGAPLRTKDAHAVFEIIATELRNQYTLSIVPSEPLATKKWHKIKVKVNVPRDAHPQVKGLTVRAREGFYAR